MAANPEDAPVREGAAATKALPSYLNLKKTLRSEFGPDSWDRHKDLVQSALQKATETTHSATMFVDPLDPNGSFGGDDDLLQTSKGIEIKECELNFAERFKEITGLDLVNEVHAE